MVAGAGRQLAQTQSAQFPAQRLLGDGYTELVPEPVQQVGNPPTYDPMHRRDRSILDDLAQGRPVMVGQARLRARRLAGQQARRSRVIETQHPVAHRLQADPADLRRGQARFSVVDRRQGEQPTDLAGIVRGTGKPTQSGGIVIAA